MKWWSSTGGTPLAFDDMNTAVPRTRGGCVRRRSPRNRSSGNIALAISPAMNFLPACQVTITVKMEHARRMGNQPPSKSFVAVDAKKARSTTRNAAAIGKARHCGQCQALVMTT